MTPLHALIQKLKFGFILAFGIFSMAPLSYADDFVAKCSTAGTTMRASKPPMGWNSFDAYDSRITEDEFRANVEVLDEKFKAYGYDHVVIDYIWHHDNPGSWDNPKRRFGHPDLRMDENGVPLDKINMDEYGRVIPSPLRFPSSTGGKGFKPLADWVHSKGLKFGIHIMRGIPRQAYYENLPIRGTQLTAKDVAEPWDQCNWNNHMYGVDGSKAGAQEYYNSIFQLYADWGVDFVKADNMLFPEYHKDDIEMMHKAIQNTGRNIILSLSNGEAPVAYAEHLAANSDLFRISADFWDRWDSLKRNFELADKWQYWIGRGAWPDADMIPFGKISLGGRPHGPERMTEFTEDEQYTLMNLWSMIRSPLMIGACLLELDELTYKLLTNKDLIYINQNTENNRRVFNHNERVIWYAEDRDSDDFFISLFNLADVENVVTFNFELLHLRDQFIATNLWTGETIECVHGKLSAKLNPHASSIFRIRKRQ